VVTPGFRTISKPSPLRTRKHDEPSPPEKSSGVRAWPTTYRAARPTMAFGGYLQLYQKYAKATESTVPPPTDAEIAAVVTAFWSK